MNVILLPILAIVVLAFAYRYLGRLALIIGDDGAHYDTKGATEGGSQAVARLHDLGVLGTPLLLAGAAFSLRLGWAPVLLWVLLSGTTLGAAAVIARSRILTPARARLANNLARLLISAVLALLWAGLAAHATHALLTFIVLYLAADRLLPFLAARRGDLAFGVPLLAGIGVLFAAIGLSWPLALAGPVHLVIGPYRRITQAAPLFFYALLFVMLIQKKRGGRLVARPAYGAVGALLLATSAVAIFGAALIGHPTMAIPRLRAHHLDRALPILAAALPFAAALAPFGDNPLARTPIRGTYAIVLWESALAVAFLVAVVSGFATQANWAAFYAPSHASGVVALLTAGVAGDQRLMGLIGLGPWVSQILLASLLLLTIAALESQQERLGREERPFGRVQPLMATALLGAGLWVARALSLHDELFVGALLGVGASWALILSRRAFPPFMVSLAVALLVLTDTAIVMIGWTHAAAHPGRAALSVGILAVEAVAAVRLWRSPSRSEDHASRHSGHQP